MEDHNHQDGEIVLRVYIHCESCGHQVLKCIREFEGVERVEIDAENDKVTVHGLKADPVKVVERLRQKTGKHVELLHPLTIKKKEEKKEEQPPKVIEVELKINIHCRGCAKDLKHCIHDMEGVQSVDVDMKKNVVKVKGNMDPHKLVKFISKRGGKHAEIVKQSEANAGNQMQITDDSTASQQFYAQQVYAPQFFSDENPNSCYVM